MKNRALITGAVLAVVAAGAAQASHNRGSALIPSIDGNGNLTIEATSFWRPTAPDDVDRVRITTPGGTTFNLNMGADTVDASDSRFTRVDETAFTNISGYGAGKYTISWSNCCRVGGIPNASGSMGTTSTIVWDGSSSTNPITFDIQNIQPNVVRGAAYSDNLDVTSSNGDTLSYDDSILTLGIGSQAPGYSISSTGQIEIDAASTATYGDNNSNAGADMAFSGEIIATAAGEVTGTVQFDWLFDAVEGDDNQVPTVQDLVINATVGDLISETMTAFDPNPGDDVTLSFLSFSGPGTPGGETFTPGAAGNPTSGLFTWDSTGSVAGTYIATFRTSDGLLSDQGTLTINLTAVPAAPVPLPATALLLGGALVGLGGFRRIRKRRH